MTKQDTTSIFNFSFCLNFSFFTIYQCAFLAPRSGSGIGDGKKSRSWIRDEHSGSYFLKLGISFLVKKNLNSLMWIRIRYSGSCQPWIRDPGGKKSDPESGIIIPDPQHCCLHCVLQDVFVSAFDGLFKEQRSAGENWLAVEPHRVPTPRPGENVYSSIYIF